LFFAVLQVLCITQIDAAVPQIASDDQGITISVPEDTNVWIKYLSSDGLSSKRVRVLTEDDLAVLTEMIARKTDNLETKKADVAKTNAVQNQLQQQLSDVIKLVGNLETKVNASVGVSQEQSDCHSKGLLWTSDGCNRLTSCGDTIDASSITGGRVSTSCASKHFYNDNCTAACPAGYDGDDLRFVCELDGLWSPVGASIDCVDVDECSNGNNKCEQNCVNTKGSYACTCKDGFTLSNDNYTCTANSQGSKEFRFITGDKAAQWAKSYRLYNIVKGVKSITITAFGSGGQPGSRYDAIQQAGGAGARVTATVPVKAGENYYILIGGPGMGRGIEVAPMTASQKNEGVSMAYGGGLVGVFTSRAVSKDSSVLIAGGGGAGSTTSNGGIGGNGGETGTTPVVGNPAAQRCTGRGADADAGGLGKGIVNAGLMGGDGGLFHAGLPGNYGNGGGVGFYGGGGGGHCPNVCGCGGGGGSSFVINTATSKQFLTARGSPSGIGGRVIITPNY